MSHMKALLEKFNPDNEYADAVTLLEGTPEAHELVRPIFRFQFPMLVTRLTEELDAYHKVVFDERGNFMLASVAMSAFGDMKNDIPFSEVDTRRYIDDRIAEVGKMRGTLLLLQGALEQRLKDYLSSHPLKLLSFDMERDNESVTYTGRFTEEFGELLEAYPTEEREEIVRHIWASFSFVHWNGTHSEEDYSPTGKWFWGSAFLRKEDDGYWTVSQSCNLDC